MKETQLQSLLLRTENYIALQSMEGVDTCMCTWSSIQIAIALASQY